MGTFKRGTGFGSAKRSGYQREGGRSSFNRGGARSEDREMFNATCASCQKPCQVPFRPSGDRPVFCRDCFGSTEGSSDNRGRHDDRGLAPRFERSESNRTFTSKALAPDSRIDDLKHQMHALDAKLDRIIQLVGERTRVTDAVKPRMQEAEKVVEKKVVKKKVITKKK